MKISPKTERIHALDALRAVMMMLGIVLHATEPYSLGTDAFWPKDPHSRSALMNYIFGIIHVFRMPIFFLIAGFFGALLYYERGPKSMLKNRFSRVVLPFFVFLLFLHPIIVSAFSFTESAFETKVSPIVTTLSVLPRITYHLWFLYYLIFITVLSFGLATCMRRIPSVSRFVQRSFNWLMRRRLFFILTLSIVVFALLVWMWDTWISTSVSFTPNLPVLVAYSVFYFFGWVLFKSRGLLDSFLKFDRQYLGLAVLVFTGKEIYHSAMGDVVYGALNAIVVWFFVFGFIGVFMRMFSNHSSSLRYISDASYWVYLIHLPLTGFIPGLLVDLPVSAFVKFLIVVALTTVFSFATYHTLVRGTFIGKFLNGRKYPTRLVSENEPKVSSRF